MHITAVIGFWFIISVISFGINSLMLCVLNEEEKDTTIAVKGLKFSVMGIVVFGTLFALLGGF